MTLKEKFQDVKVMFEGQEGYLGYDEFCEASDKCEKIADNYAIEFAKWNSYRYKYLNDKGWFNGSYQLEMDIFLSSKELLKIFKKEKGL